MEDITYEELKKILDNPTNTLYLLDSLRKDPCYNTPFGKLMEASLLGDPITSKEIAEALEISVEEVNTLADEFMSK